MRGVAGSWVMGFCLVAGPWLLSVGCTARKTAPMTQEELVRRTQELFDAVSTGEHAPFDKYFSSDAMFFDEKGRNMDKTALLKDVTPLPAGYSGSITVVNPQARLVGNTAILSYDLNETETIFGQNMTARYHETDTWLLRDGEWKIVAGQVLRYYEDPAPGKADLRKYRDYVGQYELASGKDLSVIVDEKNLYAQKSGRERELLIPEAPDIFFRKGVEGRFLFRRREDGKVDAAIDRRNNEDVVWRKIR